METWNLRDPYVYQALQGLENRKIAVHTVRGSVQGVLSMVTPDYIVVEMGGALFHIRTAQIIWFYEIVHE
mgnify:CR=1 FL=1